MPAGFNYTKRKEKTEKTTTHQELNRQYEWNVNTFFLDFLKDTELLKKWILTFEGILSLFVLLKTKIKMVNLSGFMRMFLTISDEYWELKPHAEECVCVVLGLDEISWHPQGSAGGSWRSFRAFFGFWHSSFVPVYFYSLHPTSLPPQAGFYRENRLRTDHCTVSGQTKLCNTACSTVNNMQGNKTSTTLMRCVVETEQDCLAAVKLLEKDL